MQEHDSLTYFIEIKKVNEWKIDHNSMEHQL